MDHRIRYCRILDHVELSRVVSKATSFALSGSNNFQDSLLKSIILCSPIYWVKRYNLGAVQTSCHLEQESQFTTPNDQSHPSLNTKHSATMKTEKGRKKGHTEKNSLSRASAREGLVNLLAQRCIEFSPADAGWFNGSMNNLHRMEEVMCVSRFFHCTSAHVHAKTKVLETLVADLSS